MTQCATLARGKVLRLTRLDACGTPVEGDASIVVSGFVSVTATPAYLDAEEIQQTDANGQLCIDDQGDPALRWVDLSIVLCQIDPDLINVMTGDPLVLNDATVPEAVGWRLDAAVTGTARYALEVWSGISGQACDPAGNELFGYWLWPFVGQSRFGEAVIQNGALTTTLTARTFTNSNWGVGPYDVRRDAVTPATAEPLLTPIGATQPQHFEIVSVAPPAAACGATPLVIP